MARRRIRFAFLASFATFAATDLQATGGSYIVVDNDAGGELIRYALWSKKIDESGEAIHFRGRCDSACTLFLSLSADRLCINWGVSFGFHLPYGASVEMNEVATEYMRKVYPPWVNEWIDSGGGLTPEIKRMDFDYASQHISTCPRREWQVVTAIRSILRKL